MDKQTVYIYKKTLMPVNNLFLPLIIEKWQLSAMSIVCTLFVFHTVAVMTVNFKLLELKEAFKMKILKFISRKLKMMKLKRKLLRMAERRSHQVNGFHFLSESK